MKKLLAILGPTAVGKSKLAVEVAERYGGEIVSVDSMQVYKYFDIGTDKVSAELRQRIPHHMIDVVDDCRQFTAADFARMAACAVEDISRRGKLPILVGGTGLYLRALLEGLFPVGSAGEEFRNRWKQHPEELVQRTMELDPHYYVKIGASDRKRMIRLMEVFYLSGFNMTENFARTEPFLKDYRVIKIALNLKRAELYRRIEERVEEMFRKGLVEEVKRLLEMGYSEDCPPFNAIGYKYVVKYLKGELPLEEVKRLMKRDTKHYARRQLIWLRKEKGVRWFNAKEKEEIFNYLDLVLKA